jgi:type I site-specific restriction endonuclease
LTTLAAMGETSARHDKEIGALRGETTALRAESKDYATVVAHQMDALSARLGLSQEDLTGLKSTVAEISRKVAGYGERIDRQGEVIRAITDSQAKRAVAFDELLAVLTRLKAPPETAIAAGAGQF